MNIKAEDSFEKRGSPDHIHVYPLYGKAHVMSDCCWCEPQCDYEFPELLVHRASH